MKWLFAFFILLASSLFYHYFFQFSHGPIRGLRRDSLYGVYYGNWSDDLVQTLTGMRGQRRYDLLIVHPRTNLNRDHVDRLKAAGVKVFCYLSIGEDSFLHTDHWYLQDRDGKPQRNGAWGSYFVNPASSSWHEALKNFRNQEGEGWYGYDYLIHTLGCDGLFLDTVDVVSPWSGFSAMEDMVSLIEEIRKNIPHDRSLIVNRGLFFLDTKVAGVTETLKNRFRKSINGLLFENFMKEDNRDYWANLVSNESRGRDGFTVFTLDYVEPQRVDGSYLRSLCHTTRTTHGWLPYVSTRSLDQFFHYVRDDCE